MTKNINNFPNSGAFFPKALGNFLIENNIFSKDQSGLTKAQKFKDLKEFYLNKTPKEKKEIFESFVDSLDKDGKEKIRNDIAIHVAPENNRNNFATMDFRFMSLVVLQSIIGIVGAKDDDVDLADNTRQTYYPSRAPSRLPTPQPSSLPSAYPSELPTPSPSFSPSFSPSQQPSFSMAPSPSPTGLRGAENSSDHALALGAIIGIVAAAIVVIGSLYKIEYDRRNKEVEATAVPRDIRGVQLQPTTSVTRYAR